MSATRDALDSLPPWEAIPYFEAITERVVSYGGVGSTQLCKADPNRVALILTVTQAGTFIVSTRNLASATQGIALTNALPPLVLLFSETGPLCQQAWFVNSGGGANVTVYEIVLSKWPKANGRNGRAKRANGARRK